MKPADLAFAFMLGFATNIASNVVYDAVNGEARKNRGAFPIHAGALAGAGMVMGALLLYEVTRDRSNGPLPQAPWS